MLYLIGLGITDEKDISLKAIEIAKKSECFCELYTSNWEGSLENLGKIIGKEIKKLDRNDLEEDLQKLLDLAKEKDIAIFVPGDPLAATTHIELVIQCKKQKIPVSIIHNNSILTAVSETGLQLYKFGRTITVPLEGKLDSVKDSIENNKKIGLHTLLLLDIGMSVEKAVERLIEENVFNKEEKIIGAHFGKEQKIVYDFPLEVKGVKSPSVLIIPGKLHFKEKEFLEMI